ncbi:MAG: alpha/beta hydrolase [Zymomonas mobilis]|uniref:Palmitoyl-protein thioesterase ABHD10, mitochondrial n=1 Tax=Zymomonas mobilis TaxID=542 RepID=A0A542W0U7_ZYMMB|nr:alpha/beta hydrolase [Zymomonas mobilis]TQL17200.1 pimeloyl-ACP methyl ester carboxylesterase [Zymomonas mobilis]
MTSAFIKSAHGKHLAYHKLEGAGPTIVFLPGYMSDMHGSKAIALGAWAAENKRSCLRFDYSGCGESEGDFTDGTLTEWLEDSLSVIDQLTQGPLILVGSSMGGWLMLLVALNRPDRVAGLIGLAPAPDFTEWGFIPEEKATIQKEGKLVIPMDEAGHEAIVTKAFWESGQKHLVMNQDIAIHCPIRLIQGQKDTEVPWQRAWMLSEKLISDDIRITMVKNADHRLSRSSDIHLIINTLSQLLAEIPA